MKNTLQNLILTLLLTATASASSILIVNDGTFTGVDIVSNVSAKATAIGLTPTSSVGIPAGSLNGYSELWDASDNPLTASDISRYMTYLTSGGTLYLMGENFVFSDRDNSLVSLINAAGGGSFAITNNHFLEPTGHQTIFAPFDGPNPLSLVQFDSPGGITDPGTGAYIAKQVGGLGSAALFSPGKLANAPSGTLIVVLDSDFLWSNGASDAQTFTENLLAYGVPPQVGVAGTPEPGSIVLLFTGLVAVLTTKRANLVF